MSTIEDVGPGVTAAPRVVADAARGRRVVTLDPAGRPVRVELPDGESLHVTRDPTLQRLALRDGHGTLIARIHTDTAPGAWYRRPPPPGVDTVHRVSADDPTGTTSLTASATMVRQERDGAVLRIDSDPDGRPARVTLPGLARDLHYRPVGAGCWDVTVGGVRLLGLAGGPDALRCDLGEGAGWVRREWPGVLTFTGTDGTEILTERRDRAGRVHSRRWPGTAEFSYERDDRSRLVTWTRTGPDGAALAQRRTYSGPELSAVVTGRRRTVVRTDVGGRVRRLIGPSQTVTFDYDPNGRRTRRTSGTGDRAATEYRYDALGQLVEARGPDGESTRYGWDGLGRRLWVERAGRRFTEHRDPTGRLWSVTDADGALVHAFVWWEGRVLARLGPDGRLDEAYLTDRVGTLLGLATPASGWVFSEAIQPPFGAVTAAWRPTLFGHIADGATTLICFGGRELDTETGTFLTPDPWHGGPDDPRAVGGQTATELARVAERPASGVHAYHLSQGDPLSRPDVDGHFAWGNLVLTIFLGPTWGFPLTSLSVFAFEPLNLYFEIFGLLGALFTWNGHPWPQHSLGTMRGGTAGRVGTVALALNGFIPRVFAGGIDADRAVTIGHVAWENRRFFELLDRPRVLELDDVRGTPRPDGTPSGDARAFSDVRQGSVLALVGTDTDARTWVQGTWWSRGPGNAVGLRGGRQSFEDRGAAGAAHVRGTMFMAQPLREIMPRPFSADDGGRIEVHEYAAVGGHSSTGVLVSEVWFAFSVPADAGLAAATVVEVAAAGAVAPAYGAITQVVPASEPVVILDHELPSRFHSPSVRADAVALRVMTSGTATSAGWAAVAAPPNRAVHLTAPGHPVAVDDVFAFLPTAPGGPVPATPERPQTYTRVSKVTLTLTLDPPIASLTLAGAAAFRLTTDGTALLGSVADPAAHPDVVTFLDDPGLDVGDDLAVAPTGTGATVQYARVSAVTPATPAVPPDGGTPGTPAVPASVSVEPPLTLAAATGVRVTRLKESDRSQDTGTGATQSGDDLALEVRSSAVFAVGQAVRLEVGGAHHVRRVSAVADVALETVDELVGTAPFTLTRFTGASSTTSAHLSASRFVRHTGGALPSVYGDWPAELMGLVTGLYWPDHQAMGWRFFLKGAPAGLHPDFRDTWQPLTLGADHYWLLASDLRITGEGVNQFWEPDLDDTYPDRHRQRIFPASASPPAPPIPVSVRGFVTTGVHRPDAGGGKVLVRRAEVQVPEAPLVRWSLADSLAEHELSHAVQNTYWGPLLGALPVQGVIRTLRDVWAATGDEPPTWLSWTPFDEAAGAVGFNDTNIFELFSIGGIMQLLWTFVILGPALGNEEAREALLSLDFDDWAQVFNPVNQQIIRNLPQVDPDAPADERWPIALGRFFASGLDLRSWTPFLGLVPTWLPDGEKNFLEQQASRWSGDLYSTLLTANDRFNLTTSAIGRDIHDADLSVALGRGVRIMGFFNNRDDRNTQLDSCDAPGSSLTRLDAPPDHPSGTPPVMQEFNQFFELTADATGAHLWVPEELYESVRTTAPTTVQVDGPVPSGGGAAPTAGFLRVPAGGVLAPRLRAIVPVPPAVMRSVGFYLIGAAPGTWHVATDTPSSTPAADNAHTNTAEITFSSAVRLGEEDVAWNEPFASGVPATTPQATLVERFITETQRLRVEAVKVNQLVAQAEAPIRLTSGADGEGWDLTVDLPAPPATLPHEARVRIWATIGRNDPELFDLHQADIDSLRDRRSYLDADLFVPVRDFLVRVVDLPVLPDGVIAAAEDFDVDVPVKLSGPAAIIPTGTTLAVERVEDRPPRGERWRLHVAGRRAVPEQVVVPVTVRFGTGTGTVDRTFDVTVNPNFTIDKAPAVAAYEATPAAPLVLTVTGATGALSVANEPPADSRTVVTITGTTVTVTVQGPGPRADTAYDLVLEDGNQRLGIRRITLKGTWTTVRLHTKVLTEPDVDVDTAIEAMREVYESVGVAVVHVSTEELTLPALNDVDVGTCVTGVTTAEQNTLFANRNSALASDVVVYFVRSTVPPLNGCAAHPPGRPGAVVARGATRWTLGHEVGHVLGLAHVDPTDRLMTGGGTSNITNPPPDLTAAETATMFTSPFTN
ncbi:hypothetical protein EXU48_12810 [Occultella glacieicola]|uniref:LysM domain-containing protein n=1 Tax=Occultella glacieicola TaxID=2518684 RepID=A0ABY2E1E3_9MICO|nr:hypothetical protein [Occultella glacieicola]TDE92445.1 hypothetical protein EXU48_12810 [Occultella glacieicola]